MRDDITHSPIQETAPDLASRRDLRALHGQVCGDLRSRQAWLNKQAAWYQMRHNGIPRKHKPFPHAADLHFPLADSIIEKLKPFYFNQLFATETVAQFVPKRPELAGLAEEITGWFDYKLKQQSNLECELLIAIDKMLMSGHVPVKVYWKCGAAGECGRLAFDAIEPQHCLVPEGTRDLEEADRVTLVHQLSVEQYRRDARFQRQDEGFLQRIAGRGASESGDDAHLRETRELREGITHALNSDTIIVWEIWEHTPEGWLVHWISPLAPEEPLRPTQRNPFAHGLLPIVRFDAEVKDKGHYSARGVCERVSAYETALTKAWNEKTDYMTFCNRPLFTSASPIPNAGNLRLLPGQIIPGGLQAVTMPAPPVSFDQEMTGTRQVAEYNIGMPDFGLSQQGENTARRTATEIHQVSGLLNVTMELRGRTFRLGLGKLLRLAWSTLAQYDSDTEYYVLGDLRVLSNNALLADGWRLDPNGSPESWNRAAQMQRAIDRKQLFAGAPWIDQRELDRSILELDDPRLVKRLFLTETSKTALETLANEEVRS